MRGGLGLSPVTPATEPTTSAERTEPTTSAERTGPTGAERTGPTGTEPTRSVPDYDGRSFRPVDAAGSGTVGRYRQDGDLVVADFAGPAVRAGRLVGRRRPDGVLDAVYCYLTAAGDAVAGECVSTPELLADGRVRLTEHWRRLDGSTGVSHIEEIRG